MTRPTGQLPAQDRPTMAGGDTVPRAGRANSVARAWLHGIAVDRQRYPPHTVVIRSLRRARLLLAPAQTRAILASPSLAAHAAEEGHGDALFCLSSRHYLARGLAPRARIAAAACHYLDQDRRFDRNWHEAVTGGGDGVMLWRHPVPPHDHDIVLRRARDVADEGALSLIFGVDGGFHCVLSFALVPGRVLQVRGEPALPEHIWFITRKHLTMLRDYQPDFHRAFHRVSPAQMALSALAGMVRAMGHDTLACIGAARQPSHTPDRSARFIAAYDNFWRACGAKPMGDNFLLPVPLPHKPISELPGPKRKRARLRQAVQQEVEEAAFVVTRQHLSGG